MKRIGIFILVIFMNSCYEKDTQEPILNDEGLILGNWEAFEVLLFFEDGTQKFWDENLCGGLRLDFYEDGRLRFYDFEKDNQLENNCYENPNTLPFGTWKRLGISDYEFRIFDEFLNTELILRPSRILFSEMSSNLYTMEIIFSGAPENAPKGVESYFFKFFPISE